MEEKYEKRHKEHSEIDLSRCFLRENFHWIFYLYLQYLQFQNISLFVLKAS